MRGVTIRCLAAVALFAGTLLAASPAVSANDTHPLIVRWDLTRFVGNVIVAGGRDVSTDAATGDRLTLTGSGHAEPHESEAAGGGTFVHRKADGTVFARGAYYITRFVSWEPLDGSLDGLGLIDGIGNGAGAPKDENEETGGVLTLRANFVPVVGGEPQAPVGATLIINCHLPGATEEVEEGVEVTVPHFDLDFEPTSGTTLFHMIH